MRKFISSLFTLLITNNQFYAKTNQSDNRYQLHIAPIGHGVEYIDEGMGTPIIFLHGALSNINTWRKVIPELNKSYRCIAINLPLGGHTIPIGNNVDLSPAGISEIINKLLIYLGLEKVILVSNDTGGAYAQVFTSFYPSKVEKLILSNCDALDIFPPPKFAYLRFAVKVPGFNSLMGKLFNCKGLLRNDMMLGLLSSKLSNDELHKLYVHNFINNKDIRENFGSVAQTWHPKYTLQAADKLKKFNKPVLILWGNKDYKLFPLALAEKVKNIFPDARLVEIENSRTYIQEDQPEQTIYHIMKFLNN